MQSELPATLAAAAGYDRIAAVYDDQLRDGQWMRAALWATYRRLFRPGQRVLDLACGTGVDTLYLAQLGLSVVGIDISQRMIEQLEAKARRRGLAQRIRTCVHDIADLRSVDLQFSDLRTGPCTQAFDGILSAFAGLSVVDDLAPLARDAACLLKPGGYLVAHMLSRGRDPGRTTLTANIGGVPVSHHLYHPGEAYRQFFEPHFVLRRARSFGALRPARAPRWLMAPFKAPLLNLLGMLERMVAGRDPFVNWGQFFVLEMQKRDGLTHAPGDC